MAGRNPKRATIPETPRPIERPGVLRYKPELPAVATRVSLGFRHATAISARQEPERAGLRFRATIDASVIKNVNTHRKIEETLDLYDSVVLPMRLNEDIDFLDGIREKERIILFANAGCALTCPSKLCHPSISRLNKVQGGKFQCPQPIKERDLHGMVDFPLQPYRSIGITRFKLLRARPNKMTGY